MKKVSKLQIKNEPLISVIIPFYNVKPFFEDCLKSVIYQTFQNLEIILVNDGSNDGSVDIANKYLKSDTRFKLINQNNKGISAARNTGVKNATGKYLTFIDSDDFVSKNYIQYLYELLIKNECLVSIGAHYIYQNDHNIVFKGFSEDSLLPTKNVIQEILLDKKCDLSLWGKLYTSSLFNDITFPEGKLFEDTAVTYKLLLKCNSIICGSQANYYYRKRINSITTSQNFLQKMDLIQFTKQMTDEINCIYPDISQLCRKRLVWSYFSTLNQLYKCNSSDKFLQEETTIIYYLKKNAKEIITNKIYSKQEKIAIILLLLNKKLYSFVYNTFYNHY